MKTFLSQDRPKGGGLKSSGNFYRYVLTILMVVIGQLTLVSNGVAQSEKYKLTGKVIGASNGESLPGVNVLVKGTQAGTVTDMDGNFALQVSENDTLMASFIGYLSEEIPVNGQSQIEIGLVEDIAELDEVVVVGYGTQQKKTVTGATVAVKAEDIQKVNSGRLESAMQGQTPGVQVTATSGQPGESPKVTIRGIGTTGDAAPLYVVDGVPTTDISYLDASSIERMDVLKDAASAAIYGARAANGVVLITTRKGSEGDIRLSFDGYYGIQNPYRKVPLLNATEYATIINEASINNGQDPVYSQDQIANFGEGTDWQEQAFNRNAPYQNYSLGLSGGSKKSTFSSSLSYFDQEGIIGGDLSKSRYERVSFTINSAHNAYEDIIRIGQNLTYTRSKNNGVGVGGIYDNAIRGFLNASPIFDPYDSNGDFARSPINQETNPLGALYYNNFNETTTNRLLGDIYVEVQPIPGLTFRSDFGVDLGIQTNNGFSPEYELSSVSYNYISSATQGSSNSIRWNWDNTVRYNTDFGRSNLEVLLGTTAQQLNEVWMSATKQGLTFDDFDHAVLNNGTIDTTVVATGNKYQYALVSYFGRINYNFNEKYLLSAVVRRDGSSNFGQNNSFAMFPALSAGWVVSEEGFFGTSSWLNFLKIRAGWGQNGNDRLVATGSQNVNYPFVGTISSQYKDYYFGTGETKYVGSSPNKLANPDIRWETSEQINLGIDATIMNNLDITVDAYQKSTKDWLVQAPIPQLVGVDNPPYINGGTIVNRGVEVQLNYSKTFGDLTSSITLNGAYNQNKVTEIDNPEKIIHGDANILFQGIDEINRAEVGYPIGYFYGLEVDGIFQNEEEIASYTDVEGNLIQPSAVPGDVRFRDLNGDGAIDQDDKTMIGNPNPDVTFGLNLNLGYKGFDLSLYSYGMAGQQNVMGLRSNERYFNNYSAYILNRWHGEGTSNTLPRVTYGNESNQNYTRFSELYVYDASFYRIKTITLGYDFTKMFENTPFSQARLYVSANNLLTLTRYPGADPEIGFAPTTQAWGSGIDVGYYPQPRIFMLGVNLKF